MDPAAWYWTAISASELQPGAGGSGGSDSLIGPSSASSSSSSSGDKGVYEFYFGSGSLGLVLSNIPQVLPFDQRVFIFRLLMETDRAKNQPANGFLGAMGGDTTARLTIRRQTLYEDSFSKLNALGAGLKGRIKITLVNEHGIEEAGIDGGGVFKEFIDTLTTEAFDPQWGMFGVTEDQRLYPSAGASVANEDYLEHFEFLGRVLGKAVYEDILVEPLFSAVFLNKLLGRHNFIDDLHTLDPEVYRNLMRLKAMAHRGESIEDLCLTFAVSSNAFGATRQWDLIPGGGEVAVDNTNVIRYIHTMANFKLNRECALQCRAFLKGFRDLVPVEWIRLFNPRELQKLIGGDDSKQLDLANLMQHTKYAGGYHPSQPIMEWFWNCVRGFDREQQASFLKFLTSCSRPPLLGFQHLHPPICIQKVPLGEAGTGEERLPTSATCMNLLKLPAYPDERTLREKLLYAINANAGFELT